MNKHEVNLYDKTVDRLIAQMWIWIVVFIAGVSGWYFLGATSPICDIPVSLISLILAFTCLDLTLVRRAGQLGERWEDIPVIASLVLMAMFVNTTNAFFFLALHHHVITS